jgi:glycine/D-amino acid oxidase-like deaminating enzyme
MNPSPGIDYLIIGQGIAGSAMAMQLLKRGYSILVFDEFSKNHSSAVAAGLFNPVTGKKMVKTWMADEIFPALFEFYADVESVTGEKFFFPRPLYRPFRSIGEQNEWMSRSVEDGFREYIDHVSVKPAFGDKVNDPLGGITLAQTGYVDTARYLLAVRRHLVSLGVYRSEVFREQDLEILENSIRYDTITARKVIFCQGSQNNANRWFDQLPIKSLKGETITVQSDWNSDVILNRSAYMVPGKRDREWIVGATYNLADTGPGITAEGRLELTEKLVDLIRVPFTIVGQNWGVRPTTPDRRPILGIHPKYSSLTIFNGLGTKGVSLAPYFSDVLIRAMENKGTINKEADVSRFN